LSRVAPSCLSQASLRIQYHSRHCLHKTHGMSR